MQHSNRYAKRLSVPVCEHSRFWMFRQGPGILRCGRFPSA